jgi:hypothetical protein
MMLKSRTLSLLVVAALFSACGGGDGDRPTSEAPAAPAAPSGQTPPPSPAPSPALSPSPSPSPAPRPQPAVTAVGTPLGAVAASVRIGPAGGRLEAPDYGLSVVVPAGAFASEQTVSLQPISATAPGALAGAWRIQPEGVTATKPITIEWRPPAEARNGTALLRIASQGADGIWRSAPATIDDEGVVRTTTLHFSDWSLVAGVQLRPAQAEVALGSARDLTVRECTASADAGHPGHVAHHACRDEPTAALNTQSWAVNGVPGGNGTLGQISPRNTIDKAEGRYAAPASLPAQNPVAVSVDYTDIFAAQPRTERLVAHVTVVDPDAGCTWLRSVQKLDMTVEQDYAWSGSDTVETVSYSHTARISGRLSLDAFQPVGQVWFSGSLGQGHVKVAHLQRSRIGKPRSIEVAGEGTPLVFAEQPTVRVYVDLSTCKMLMSVGHYVRATHWTVSDEYSGPLPDDKAGMDFSVVDFPLGGLRQWSQERLLPVLEDGTQTPVGRAAINHGRHHNFGFQTGNSRVRWTLAPR